MPLKEILWMQEAGVTPMQIIVAGTQNAAVVCNLGSVLGTLEPGKIADILVIDGNPLQDLTNLKKVRLVIKEGVVIRSSGRPPFCLNSGASGFLTGKSTTFLTVITIPENRSML
jgi:adenine deaminase